MLGWSTQLGNKLFGQDPKLEFRKPGQGADLLAAPRTIPIDDPYWSQYLTLFDSPSDVLYLLPSSLLLRTLHSNPRNLVTLFSFATNHLFSLLDPESDSNRAARAAGSWNQECLSCVRVLTRLVPLLLGPQGTGIRDEVEDEIFWKRQVGRESPRRPESETDAPPGEGTQFVLENDDDDDDEEDGNNDAENRDEQKTPRAPPTREGEDAEAPCLAERLIATLINLLFVPGFTLTSSSTSALVNYSIWEPGIASPFPAPQLPTPPRPVSILSARSEILRLLVVLVSLPSLLTPPHAYNSTPNRFRELLVTGQALRAVATAVAGGSAGGEEKNVILCLLCSLVNTACQAAGPPRDEDDLQDNDSASDDQGVGGGLRASATRFAVEAAKSATGFTHIDEARRTLVSNCLELLSIVLIDHAPTSSSPTASPTNLFEFYLSKLHRPLDFSFLFSGLVSHVYDALSSPSSLLPNLTGIDPSSPSAAATKTSSSASPGSSTEALTVLWRLIDRNAKFSHWLVTHCRGREWAELVALLQVVRNEWSADETQIGLVRLSSFLIQTLTAETALVALNSTATDHAVHLERCINGPVRGVASGRRRGAGGQKMRELIKRQCEGAGIETFESVTLVEYLIMSAHALILSPNSNKSGRLSTLYPSIVLSLSNLSPFMIELSNDASTRLCRIWLAFSAPSWVLMEEGNPRLIYYLLETFNNVLFHHFETNSKFVYALLQVEKRFRLLEGFTLEVGVTEARRLRAERRKQQQQQQHHQSSFDMVKDGGASSSSLLSPTRSRLSVSSNISSGGGGSDDEVRMSEKALGKRRESDTTTTTIDASASRLGLDDLRADAEGPFVGKNGFIPTEAWVDSWTTGLPLDPILALLTALVPLTSHCPTRTTTLDAILSHAATLVEAVKSSKPTGPGGGRPHPKPRRFVLTEPLQTWLGSTVYGRVYLDHLDYWRDGLVEVQLFGVVSTSSSASSQTLRGRIGAVTGLERTVEQVGRDVGQFARGVLGRVGGAAR
ncbi:hypothetical protein JCM11491_000841 [Sporobolomyces phaffii]